MTTNSFSDSPRPEGAAAAEAPLESWKEIAAYLKRDVRTVKRWEKSEGLPVRRHQHQARASVYAYPSELDAWLATRQPAAEQPGLWFRRPVSALAMVAMLLLALVSVASGPLAHPAGVTAQEVSATPAVTVRRVWTAGRYVGLEGSSVSPDGRYLAFTDWTTGDLAVHDFTSGGNRRLTNKGPWSKAVEFAELFTRFSADGKQVAYLWDREGKYELQLVGLDGSRSRLLYRNEELNLFAYDWSADGKHIVAALITPRRANGERTVQIVLIALADGSVQPVKSFSGRAPGAMSFSPDGRFLAYDFPPEPDSPQRDLFVVSTDGRVEVPLVTHPADDRLLGWVPGGSAVLFASNRGGTTGAWLVNVKEGRSESSPRLVKADLAEGLLPLGFTRDGSYLFATSESVRESYTGTLDLARGALVGTPVPASGRLLGSNAGPDWSPDGKFLAYIHGGRRAQPESIVIRTLESGAERTLAPATLNAYFVPGWGERYLRWSPDGRSLLANGRDNKGARGLFRIDVEAATAHALAVGLRARYGRWSRDGKAVFYTQLDPETFKGQIVRRELETGRNHVLYRPDSPPGLDNISSLEISPDGAWLAFSGFALEKGPGDETLLMLLPASGGEPKLLLKVPESEWLEIVGWTPDGREILFTRERKTAGEPSTTVWRISVQGGEPERIELGMNVLNDIRFHPDGRRVAFDSGEYRTAIWVMENFLPAPKTGN